MHFPNGSSMYVSSCSPVQHYSLFKPSGGFYITSQENVWVWSITGGWCTLTQSLLNPNKMEKSITGDSHHLLKTTNITWSLLGTTGLEFIDMYCKFVHSLSFGVVLQNKSRMIDSPVVLRGGAVQPWWRAATLYIDPQLKGRAGVVSGHFVKSAYVFMKRMLQGLCLKLCVMCIWQIRWMQQSVKNTVSIREEEMNEVWKILIMAQKGKPWVCLRALLKTLST